jgi:hypothetical protein
VRWCAVDETHTAPPTHSDPTTNLCSTFHASHRYSRSGSGIGRCDYWARKPLNTTDRRGRQDAIILDAFDRSRVRADRRGSQVLQEQPFKLFAQRDELGASRRPAPQRCCQVDSAPSVSAAVAVPAAVRLEIDVEARSSIVVQWAVNLARAARSFAGQPPDVEFRCQREQRIIASLALPAVLATGRQRMLLDG